MASVVTRAVAEHESESVLFKGTPMAEYLQEVGMDEPALAIDPLDAGDTPGCGPPTDPYVHWPLAIRISRSLYMLAQSLWDKVIRTPLMRGRDDVQPDATQSNRFYQYCQESIQRLLIQQLHMLHGKPSMLVTGLVPTYPYQPSTFISQLPLGKMSISAIMVSVGIPSALRGSTIYTAFTVGIVSVGIALIYCNGLIDSWYRISAEKKILRSLDGIRCTLESYPLLLNKILRYIQDVENVARDFDLDRVEYASKTRYCVSSRRCVLSAVEHEHSNIRAMLATHTNPPFCSAIDEFVSTNDDLSLIAIKESMMCLYDLRVKLFESWLSSIGIVQQMTLGTSSIAHLNDIGTQMHVYMLSTQRSCEILTANEWTRIDPALIACGVVSEAPSRNHALGLQSKLKLAIRELSAKLAYLNETLLSDHDTELMSVCQAQSAATLKTLSQHLGQLAAECMAASDEIQLKCAKQIPVETSKESLPDASADIIDGIYTQTNDDTSAYGAIFDISPDNQLLATGEVFDSQTLASSADESVAPKPTLSRLERIALQKEKRAQAAKQKHEAVSQFEVMSELANVLSIRNHSQPSYICQQQTASTDLP
ncbi:hypothetical protein BSLG_007131 [Batrachochytrium salamandrivorans]|nr:hypothetical protein BSLG_007131 [Batrachochytrium salamandrivorans]